MTPRTAKDGPATPSTARPRPLRGALAAMIGPTPPSRSVEPVPAVAGAQLRVYRPPANLADPGLSILCAAAVAHGLVVTDGRGRVVGDLCPVEQDVERQARGAPRR